MGPPGTISEEGNSGHKTDLLLKRVILGQGKRSIPTTSSFH